MLRTYQEKHTENKERYPKRKMKTEREREEKKERERATDRFHAGEVTEVKLSWMRHDSKHWNFCEFLEKHNYGSLQ